MTTFTPVSLPQIAPADPSKHVNYEIGMVLGVDDFVQEFAYSSGRDQRIVRDLIGYGVVSGLRVTVDTATDGGPVVGVAPGELVTPSGQFVCVSPAQCANLNDWLAANLSEIEQQISSPPPSALALWVVAGYAECLTDPVPIPGEPCRSDDELAQPSRAQDSFSLSLSLTAPANGEDIAIGDFVRWVRSIPVLDIAPGDVDAFIEELRQALQLEASPPSPVGLLDFLYASPPPSVQIPRSAAAQYLAALFDFWASDLRALVRGAGLGGECACTGGPAPLDPAADCLSIAALHVPLAVDAQTGALTVADAPAITIDAGDTIRPTLLHLKMLQEWVLAEAVAAEAAPALLTGRFAASGATVAATPGLTAHPLPIHSPPAATTLFLLTFPSFSPTADYVVTGQAVAALADPQASTFEVISADDPGLVAELGSPPAAGIVVRVRQGASAPVPGGFMVRVQELPDAGAA